MHNSDRWAYQATYKIHSHMCNILLKIYTILKIRFLIGLQLHTGFVYKARFFCIRETLRLRMPLNTVDLTYE